MEEDIDFDCYNVESAFLCYEVQRTLICYLNIRDLKNLRLVNKLWERETIPALREKSVLSLNSADDFQKYQDFLQGQTENSLWFSNYQITIKPDTFSSLREAVALFAAFWEACGSNVKQLTLRLPWTCCYQILSQIYCANSGQDGLNPELNIERLSITLENAEAEDDCNNHKWIEETIAEDCYEFRCKDNPVLRGLHLDISIVFSSDKKVFPFTWQQFLESCPNICQVTIKSDYASSSILKLLGALVDKQRTLKTLQIGTRNQRLFSDELLNNLNQIVGPNTSTLSLGFLPSLKHETTLDNMLRQGSQSLQNITFLQYRTVNQTTISTFSSSERTRFPKLLSLRITKDFVTNLGFLVKMPKLKRLEILRDCIGNHEDLSNPIIRTRTLPVVMENLQSLLIEPFVPLEHVWKLTNWFPNLERLQMKANDPIARAIFTKWTRLRDLYLIGETYRDNNDIIRSSLTDEGITGLAKEELTQLETQSGNIQITDRAVSYIGNLKELEYCKLQVIPDYQTGVTDYSVQFGLMDVPSLKSVWLVKTLVSSAAADLLRNGGAVNVTVANA